MDLSKIKTLIDFVGRSNVNELTVTRKNVTIRIFRKTDDVLAPLDSDLGIAVDVQAKALKTQRSVTAVNAPIFGILHRASAPGQAPFVEIGDAVEEGQTLFIIEAMKVFNKISAPRSGSVTFIADVDGGEVESNDLLAEIA